MLLIGGARIKSIRSFASPCPSAIFVCINGYSCTSRHFDGVAGFEIQFLDRWTTTARSVENLKPLFVGPRSDFQNSCFHCDRSTGSDILVRLVAVVCGGHKLEPDEAEIYTKGVEPHERIREPHLAARYKECAA